MKQGNISRLESPDYGKATISSLKRIADAFDVALVVRFVPFSQYTDWLSGTPFLDLGMRPESMAVESFDEEEKAGVYTANTTQKYWSITSYQSITDPSTVNITPDYGPQMSPVSGFTGVYTQFGESA